MRGWFEIVVDRQAGLVRLAMGGFFEAAEVDRLRDAVRDAVRQLGLPPGQHVTLCDITAMHIQSQEVVRRFTLLVGSPGIRSRRLAFVTAATLARLQARRLTSRPGVAFFPDPASAEAWLAAAHADAQAA